MQTLENDPRLPAWLNALLNRWPFCLDEDSMKPVLAVAYDAEGWWQPPNGSLYYNGYFFFRVYWPLGFGSGLSWKWRGTYYRWHTWFGWKGNGRFGVTCRIQTPAEAAAGVLGPNSGQASGFARGTA